MSWKRFRRDVVIVAGVVLAASAVRAGQDRVEEVERARVCMMQDKVQATAGIKHTYQGRTYYLCCPMCVGTFEGDPARYASARDPVSGQTVDKATAPVLGYRGQAYFFASDESRSAFRKDPDRYASASRR